MLNCLIYDSKFIIKYIKRTSTLKKIYSKCVCFINNDFFFQLAFNKSLSNKYVVVNPDNRWMNIILKPNLLRLAQGPNKGQLDGSGLALDYYPITLTTKP